MTRARRWIAAACLLSSPPLPASAIHPRPILTRRRLELTRRYCKAHYGLDSARLRDPRILVIHATELGTLQASLAAFAPDTLSPARRELSGHGEVNVGVHFLVDRDGAVYSLLPLDVIGRHVIGLNYTSIGIENVGFADRLTPRQLSADADLVKSLVRREPSLRYLIGHYEYATTTLPHHRLFKELDARYRPTTKTDPGPRFMAALRRRLAAAGVRLED